MGIFGTMFGGEAEEDAANANRAAIAAYQPKVEGYLKTGYGTGTENLNKSISSFDPLNTLAGKYNAGGDMYLNALGLNGIAGNNQAAGAFQNNPGYTGAINAGLDIINRRRAMTGMNASGNADIDAQTFGQNLQNQQYGDWMTRLQQAGATGVNLAGQVAQGQSGGFTNLAGLAERYAGNQAGVEGNVLSGITSANTLEAQGKAAGAKNLLGAGMTLASLAMGPMTGGASLAGMGSSLLGGGAGPTGYKVNPFSAQGMGQIPRAGTDF